MTSVELEANESVRPSRHRARRPRRRWVVHATVWPVLIVALVAGFAAWSLYGSAIEVRDELELAQSDVEQFQDAAIARQFDALAPAAESLSQHAEAAVAETEQPLWRMSEAVPMLGENLRAVRVVAEGVNEASDRIVDPAVGLLGSFGLRRDPATGAIDLAPFHEAVNLAEEAAAVAGGIRTDLDSLHTEATIPQVSTAVAQFDGLVGEVEKAIPQVQGTLAAIGPLLGADGPRNVVLAFLNSAETSAPGGGPAAQSLLAVDDGVVSVVRQVSSEDFQYAAPVDVEVDESATQLYDSILLDNINGSTSRPDFPTSARILSAWWQRDQGITPDVIISIDPLGLSRLLRVTGPVTLADGEQLTADNVVSKILNEVYFRFPTGDGSDAYFAAAASAIFDRVMNVDYDIWAMADAVIQATNAGSIMLWSADPKTEQLFDGLRIQGALPSANSPATVLGAYFRDRSSSKIDYYLHSTATVTTNACIPDAPSYTVEVRLWFDIPADMELPRYVDSNLYDFYRTEVFLYGPVGGTTASVEVPEPGLEAVMGPSVVDLGRPAEKFTVDLRNGQGATVRATFTGPLGEYGLTELRTTPMINSVGVTMVEASCAG